MGDPREESLPPVGLVTIEDAETGERKLLDSSSPRVQSIWAEAERRRRESLSRTFRSAGIDTIQIETTRPYDRPLLTFFRTRAKRFR